MKSMSPEMLLEKFYSLYDQNRWKQGEAILRLLLKREPDSAWLWSRLSSALHEQRRYKEALRASSKAFQMAPDDPLFMWDHAGALVSLGRQREAAVIYRRLIRKGPVRAGTVDCGEGVKWARSLINDARFRLAECYRELGDSALAGRWYEEFIKHQQAGARGETTIRDARRQLKSLDKK